MQRFASLRPTTTAKGWCRPTTLATTSVASGVCYDPCAEDSDCPDGATCTGEGDDGTNFCEFQAEPCEDDADCGGFGICNVDTGARYCDSDANCTADGGDVCVQP